MSDCKRAGAYLALARDYAEAAGVVVGKRADLRAHAHELALKAQVLRGEGDEAWLMSSVATIWRRPCGQSCEAERRLRFHVKSLA